MVHVERKVKRFDDGGGKNKGSQDLCSWSSMTALGLINLRLKKIYTLKLIL